MKKIETLRWIGGPEGCLRLIDQTRLPVELVEIDCRDVEAVWEAIKMLRVRGAGHRHRGGLRRLPRPANARPRRQATFFQSLEQVVAYLATSRPTAVNLFWALDRMKAAGSKLRGRPVTEIWSPASWRGPASTKKTAPCAGPSASTGRNCWTGQGVLDALQCRRAGDGRIWHGAGRVLRRRTSRASSCDLCR